MSIAEWKAGYENKNAPDEAGAIFAGHEGVAICIMRRNAALR